jgi:hypothetical protein
MSGLAGRRILKAIVSAGADRLVSAMSHAVAKEVRLCAGNESATHSLGDTLRRIAPEAGRLIQTRAVLCAARATVRRAAIGAALDGLASYEFDPG